MTRYGTHDISDAHPSRIKQIARGAFSLLGLDDLVEEATVHGGRGHVCRVTTIRPQSFDEVGSIRLLDQRWRQRHTDGKWMQCGCVKGAMIIGAEADGVLDDVAG